MNECLKAQRKKAGLTQKQVAKQAGITERAYQRYEAMAETVFPDVRIAKKIAKALQLAVSDLSMYDFRHSAITHALNAGENPFAVAQMAGTSVAKIEQHYYNGIRK